VHADPDARHAADHVRGSRGARPGDPVGLDRPGDRSAAYEELRRARVEKIIAAITRKNNAKAAGPVGRVANAMALRVFSGLVKPEKMAWMFDYRIDWDSKMSA
jgi:hypothetical protein